MKFEFNTKEKKDDCVAFYREGCLYLKERGGKNLVLEEDNGHYQGSLDWKYVLSFHSDIERKFYPGDSITLTF